MLNFNSPLGHGIGHVGGAGHVHGHHHQPGQGGPGGDVKQLLQFMAGFMTGAAISQGLQGGQHGQQGQQCPFSSQRNPGFGGASPLGCGGQHGANPFGGGNPLGGNPFGGSPLGGNPLGGNPFGGNPLGQAFGAKQCAGAQQPGQGGNDPGSILQVGIAIGMAMANSQGQGQSPLNLAGSNINLNMGAPASGIGQQPHGAISAPGSNLTMGGADFANLLNSSGPINLAGSNINVVGGGAQQPGKGGQNGQQLLAIGIALGRQLAQQQGGGQAGHQHPHAHQPPQGQATGAFAVAGVFRSGVGGVLG